MRGVASFSGWTIAIARHLPGRSRTTLHYEIRATRRGSFTLRTVYIEARSRFGLWKRYLNYPVLRIF